MHLKKRSFRPERIFSIWTRSKTRAVGATKTLILYGGVQVKAVIISETFITVYELFLFPPIHQLHLHTFIKFLNISIKMAIEEDQYNQLPFSDLIEHGKGEDKLHARHTRERPPICPRSTDVALCGWCQNGDPAVTDYEPSQFSYCCMGLVEEMGPTDQSY